VIARVPGVEVPGARWTAMQDTRERSRSNIRLAIILGVVALGFFLMGMYLAMNREL